MNATEKFYMYLFGKSKKQPDLFLSGEALNNQISDRNILTSS
jgi:hypothetical protein